MKFDCLTQKLSSFTKQIEHSLYIEVNLPSILEVKKQQTKIENEENYLPQNNCRKHVEKPLCSFRIN